MVNLLPKDIQRKLVVRYYLALTTSLCFLAALAVAIGAGLLVPSYLLAQNGADSSARYLAALEDTLGLKERGASADVTSILAERVSILTAYEGKPVSNRVLSSVSKSQNAVSGVLVLGVRIRSTGDGTGAVAVAGVAKTRATLIAFADALKADPLFSGVSVPVSQLATDADIDFSLTFYFTKP